MKNFEDSVKNFEEGMWMAAKGYVDNDDMENLEKLVKESTKTVAELAYDLGAAEKQKKKLKTAIGVGSVAAGVLGFVLYKVGRWKTYKEIINSYEEGDDNFVINDIRTGKMYEVKTECIGD